MLIRAAYHPSLTALTNARYAYKETISEKPVSSSTKTIPSAFIDY